ncbi:MAG: phosphopantetheine-binding protein [Planctomycetota bacterium]|nr:phosphopantetheine-binding protein [Planctomycetota bacterium]
MNKEEAYPIIIEAVADSLALEVEEVSVESRLIADLGADSLDFIDLIFTLEKKFGVKIREGELNFISRLDVGSPEVLQGQYLTDDAIEKLKPWLPALATVEDLTKVTPSQLFSMITVETLWIMIEKQLSTA